MRKRERDSAYYESSAPAVQIRTLLDQWKSAGKIKSYSEVARALELSPASLTNLMYGKIGPNIETLGKIASFFGVTTDYLLGRETGEKEAASIEQTISSYTGLSPAAVTALHNAYLPDSPKYVFEVVNSFISGICDNPAFADGDFICHIKAHINGQLCNNISISFTPCEGEQITSLEIDGGRAIIHGMKQEAK